MASDLNGFVKDAKALVGKEVDDVPAGTDLADWLTIRRFCAALGDPNLLYKDPGGGVATRYNSMIAPPTFVAAVRTPNSSGPYVNKHYGVSPFLTRGSFEWTDIIRVGDRLESTIKVTDVKEAGKRWGYESADVESTVEYRNSYGGLIGTGKGVNSMVAYERGKEAATCLFKMLAGQVQPVTRMIHVPIVGPNIGQSTWSHIPEQEENLPMVLLNRRREALEKTPGVINITLQGGYGYSDLPYTGMSVIVTTDGDPDLAEKLAKQMAAEAA